MVVSLIAIAPIHGVYAQDESDGDKQRATVRTQDGGREAVGPAVGRAVERPVPAPRPTPAPAPVAAAPAAAAAAAPAAEDQRRRDGGRDRGDNPAVGRAVPRGSRPAPAPPPSTRDGRNDGRYRSGGVYVAPRVYNYYYNPRRYYPYGYGAFGLGYFYYDPYTWYPPSYYSGYGYGGGGYFPNSFFEGELRLSVAPRNAEVYVDGYFAGRVDDFDGVFQALRLEEGAHHIQITAPGYLPLDFDVRIEADRKITYRGALQPYRP
jgi:PEGA domain-containing protein